MSNQQHPITPPKELFAKCYEQAERQLQSGFSLKFAMSCAIRTAYAAGADAELEACCEWVEREIGHGREWGAELRATRRPKPPSLAEQGLEALDEMNKPLGVVTGRRCDTIRAALKRLQELEQRLD